MSNGLDLSVSRSLELLTAAQHTASDFARREEQLTRDIRARRYSTNRKREDAMEFAEATFSAQIAEIDAALATGTERVRAICDGRRTRIERANARALRDIPRQARHARDKWLGDLQLHRFRADRALPVNLQAADDAHAEFCGTLAVQRGQLAGLEGLTWKAFGGYWMFQQMLRAPRSAAPPAGAADRNHLFNEMGAQLTTADGQLGAFRRFLPPRIFRILQLPLLLPLLVLICLAVGFATHAIVLGGIVAVALVGAICAIFAAGLRGSRPMAIALTHSLAETSRTHDACVAAAAALHEEERQRVQDDYDRTCAEIQEQWDRVNEVEAKFGRDAREQLGMKVVRVRAANESALGPRLRELESSHTTRRAEITAERDTRIRQSTETHETATAALVAEEAARWTELEAAWKRDMTPIYHAIDAMNAATATTCPPWDARVAESWKPATAFAPAMKFAHLDLDLVSAMPKDPRLAPPGDTRISLPLTLTFPEHGSLLFETKESGGAAVLGTLNNVILRLLTTTPPGKLTFTIIDPIGLGENFAGLMHLSDFEESVINRKIWTQRDQIEERLGELSEHIEKVIQMYLRNEYATITEYNAQAGSVAEKYHFLVVADLPVNFGEIAAKRLQSIATSGPRCGVFTLIHWDQRHQLPDGFVPDELRKNSVCIRGANGQFMLSKELAQSGAALVLDMPPAPEVAVALVQKIGKASIDSNRVEVPFVQIAPRPEEMWTSDTTHELKIAVGRTGATKQQFLAIGKGTRQHALFAGKTGSGKSTLFHVIITNLALACSPEQVEFYLIDFKKGVEFKCYASKRLPHARVIAIESDREFALSVLQRVDGELKRRGDLFRALGVQDIAGYKKAGGTEAMPRSLLLIDEFQEFFVEDDTIAQTASLLFDRIVRQGRAFGIHVLLGSQTLGGAYSLARATLGQMVIRVALQCNEADAYLIMDDSNSAPRLLTRPGEGIYNDAAGAIEGNSPFQVVWLPDDERDTWLDKVHDLAVQRRVVQPSPIVFEGNAPAEIRENDLLRVALDTTPTKPPVAARIWLGAPNSIKGPTEAVIHRQSGNHLLIVGQRDEAALSMLGIALLSLAAQYPVGGVKFVLLHNASAGSPDAEFIERIAAAVPHEITLARSQEIAEVMSGIATEIKSRAADSKEALEGAPVFLLIHGLHKFKKLRHEDDFSFSSSDTGGSPGAQLSELITEGSSLGLHIIATVDSFNNVNRAMSRKALSEFEMRVVFQMSANDSASLIDSPKASTLGLHRALFHNEHEGTLETFRPYAPPDAEWVRQAAEKLARLRAVGV